MSYTVGQSVRVSHATLGNFGGRVGKIIEIDTKSLPNEHPVFVVEIAGQTVRLQEFQLIAVEAA